MDTSDIVSDRERDLLIALVRRHIRDGEPVGSKKLVEETGLPVSSATVRSIVADLEHRGFVSSPHTSAGRVPTAKGYRFFIDSFISVQPLLENELSQLRAELDPDKTTKNLIESASTLLSSITHQAGLVTVPRQEDVILRQIEFLPLAGGRVLVILVLNEKEVQNRIIYTERDYTEVELRQASNLVNAELAGRSLDDIRHTLLKQLKSARRRIDSLLKSAIDLASRALDAQTTDSECVVAGQSNLLDGSSAENMARLRELFEVFQRKSDLLHLMERCGRAGGVQIFIGEEAGFAPLVDFSLITARYHSADRTIGVLGVIGPTRMAYDRIIPIVDVTARMLGAALRR